MDSNPGTPNIRVTVKMFASFRELAGEAERKVNVASGTTVGQLWESLVAQHPRLAPLKASAGMALNGRYTLHDTPLNDGDTVAYLPPVSGG